MKRIYLATPVNARKEKSKFAKEMQAYNRIHEMKVYLRDKFPDAEFWSVFDLGVTRVFESLESEIMGSCVQLVLESDLIILDDGWEDSKGCTVERFVALQYGKQVKTFNSFLLKDKLNK